MTFIIKFRDGRKEVWRVMELKCLSTDIKRLLLIQFKEFIDEIEDCEKESASIGSIRAIEYLDGCYQAA